MAIPSAEQQAAVLVVARFSTIIDSTHRTFLILDHFYARDDEIERRELTMKENSLEWCENLMANECEAGLLKLSINHGRVFLRHVLAPIWAFAVISLWELWLYLIYSWIAVVVQVIGESRYQLVRDCHISID